VAEDRAVAKVAVHIIIIKEGAVGMVATTNTTVGLIAGLVEATLRLGRAVEIRIAAIVLVLVVGSILNSIKEDIMQEVAASITITIAIRISTITREIILEVEIKRVMVVGTAITGIMVDMGAEVTAIITTTVDTMVAAVMAATEEVLERTMPVAITIIITNNKCKCIKAIAITTI